MNTLIGLLALDRMKLAQHLLVRRLIAVLSLGCLFLALPAWAVDPPPAGRHFDLITVGGVKYTKVTVIDVAARHVSFRSAQGFSTVLLTELEPEVRAKLGRGELDLSDAWKEKPISNKDGSALPVKAREPAVKGATKAEDNEDESEDSDSAGILHQRIDWTFKNILAMGVMGLGGLVMLVAQCWFIGVAFRTSVDWGLAVLLGTAFAGILNLIFCCMHWSVAKRPVYLNFAGAALILLGIISFSPVGRETPVSARENTPAATNQP